MKTPYLIQRGTIRRPLANFNGLPLSKVIDFDYMGSAEFEYGAVPKAFREFRKNKQDCNMEVVYSIERDGKPLRMFYYLSNEEAEQYKEFLFNLRSGDKGIRLEEPSYFRFEDDGRKFVNTDFWWDIENNVIFSFDKNFMNRLEDHLNTSYELIKD